MSARGPWLESLSEFVSRRCRELKRSGELAKFRGVDAIEFVDMLEREFYDCAEDPVQPSDEQDNRRPPLRH